MPIAKSEGITVRDYYGENDLAAGVEAASGRARALTHIPRSMQVMIPGADHFYAGREDAVVQAIDRFVRGLAL